MGKSSKGQQEQLGRILAHAQPLTDEEIAKIDDDDAFRVQLKRFFENAPLYRAWPVPGTEVRTGGSLSTGRWNRELDHVEVPESFRIEMPCPLCGPPSRTFVLDWRDKYAKPEGVTLEVDEGPHLVCFKCTHCDKKRIGYLVYLGRNTDTRALQMEMGGVYPSARPEPVPELAKGLGDAKGLFVKGLVNQHFGFGIGAFGYYRRVAEDIIDRLLEQLRQYAADAELKDLVDAIAEAEKQHQAAQRIRIVLPLIPKILRPGGQDPLGIVFGALSEGLHGGTDEECLDEADALRVALEFLVVKLDAMSATPTQFTEALKRAQEAKAKRDAAKGK